MLLNQIYRLIIIPGIITIGYFYGHLVLQEPGPASINPDMEQMQVKSHSLLLNSSGAPEDVGFMTTPLKVLNEDSLLPWQKFRLKKWDHFDVITDQFIFTLSVVDILFLGEVRVDYFDFSTRQHKSQVKAILPNKIPHLSYASHRFTAESKADDVSYDAGDLSLKVENIGTLDNDKFNTRRISFTSQELNLKLDLKLRESLKQESMTAVIPLSNEQQHFFYTIKEPNLGIEGTIKVDGQEHEILNTKGGGFIDWGRGVWTYNTYWVFARAQTVIENNKKFSLVLASGYGDNTTSTATEDSFFIDETLFKLNTVKPEFDDFNLMNPWSFKTTDSKQGFGECELVFVPHYVSSKKFNLYFLKSDMRVTFGEFNGWVSDKTGKKYTVQKMNAMIEIHKAKW